MDDKHYPLPHKFRASLDETDPQAFERLQEADAQQSEWQDKAHNPFASGHPLATAMAKARITANSLESLEDRSADQNEMLAEAYATLGLYHRSALLSAKHEELYRKYLEAVFLPDDKWCDHDDVHKFTREFIYSVKAKKIMPLLACNVCDTWNVTDEPESLVLQRAKESEVRRRVSGRSMQEVKSFLRSRRG